MSVFIYFVMALNLNCLAAGNSVPPFVAYQYLPIKPHYKGHIATTKINGEWGIDSLEKFVGTIVPTLIYYNGKVIGRANAQVFNHSELELSLDSALTMKLEKMEESFRQKQINPDDPNDLYVSITNQSTLTDPDGWSRTAISRSARDLALKQILSEHRKMHMCSRVDEARPKIIERSTKPSEADVIFNHRSFYSKKRDLSLIGVSLKGDGNWDDCHPAEIEGYGGRGENEWEWMMINQKGVIAIHHDILPLDAADYQHTGKSQWLIQGHEGDGRDSEYIKDLESNSKN